MKKNTDDLGKGVKIQITLTQEEYAILQELAEHEGKPLAQVFMRFVREAKVFKVLSRVNKAMRVISRAKKGFRNVAIEHEF